MCASFEARRKAGTVAAHGSGYGGSGFKFDAAEEGAVKALKKVAPVDIQWERIHLRVPAKGKGKGQNAKKSVLTDVSGELKAGCITAIMVREWRE